MLCFRVPPKDVEVQWQHMLRLLAPAIARSGGRWTPNDVFNELEAGRLQCWVCIQDQLFYAVGVTQVVEYPGLKVLCFHWVGGVDQRLWLGLLVDTAAEFATAEGCTRMEMVGRKGWERMAAPLGFRPVFVFFEKLLPEPPANGSAHSDREKGVLT